MRYAVSLAPFAEAADARLVSELAREAEVAGWDGFFLWDHLNWSLPSLTPAVSPGIADPWISLAACALTTSRIHLGTLVTPLFRQRPAQVARATATLQNLCGGRLILGVGLGSPDPEESADLGEETCYAKRASMTDEALGLLRELWTGRPVNHRGQHYRVKTTGFRPTPCAPIPVWAAVTHPFRPGPVRRAAACEGAVLACFEDRALRPEEVQAVGAAEVAYGWPTRPTDGELVKAYARAGLTWWVEPLNTWCYSFAQQLQRLRDGPPR